MTATTTTHAGRPHGDPAHVYIAIGTNLGDRAANIRAAVHAIAQLPGTTITALSTIHETAPLGPDGPNDPNQDPYLNAVIRCTTTISPRDLLIALNAIERNNGRDRAAESRWGPRTLDLDIILYGDRTISEPGLTIPHVRLAERSFVLAPLSEIAPGLVVPGQHATVSQLLAALQQPEAGKP